MLVGPALALYAAEPARKGDSKPARKAAASPAKQLSFQTQIAPLVTKYCVDCHGDKDPVAGISLVGFADDAAIVKARTLWTRVAERVRTGEMPPKGSPAMTEAEKTLLSGWVEAKMASVDCDVKDPGRVTMRRLNRSEYNNTIRDLLGVDVRAADDFPSDDVGYGFDNIGDVLSMSPILMEKYIAAADKVVRAAIVTPDAAPIRFEAEKLTETGGDGTAAGEARNLFTNGEVTIDHAFPQEGEYGIRVRAWGQQAGPEPARMVFRLDGKDLKTVDVPVKEDQAGTYELKTRVPAGKHRLSLAFTNDFYDEKEKDRSKRDRNLLIDWVEIESPRGSLMPKELPASHRRLFIVQPTPTANEAEKDAAAKKILTAFAKRAYRRPATTDEVNRLLRITKLATKEGESFERAIQLATQAVLVSPHFLFRVELDDKPNDPKATRSLNDWELASRLSYFLWGSMPDDALFQLAEQKQLRRPQVLAREAQRMLKDPKSAALVENFGGQWLTLRTLQNVSPDPAQFPGFNNQLRADMLKETEMFFTAVMREDRPVTDFLNGDFTFLNERLAKHYGTPGITGDNFRRVQLTGDQRRGVLTQASILTLTSNPTRTSPVKRGKWVLEQMLGTPPPPPPPNVPELKVEPGAMLTGTLRQKMEQHRTDPGCASCHQKMDPIGFGLENFDAVGAWRTKEGGAEIDSSGELIGSGKFNGPTQLVGILMKKQDTFCHNFASQMMTFALGRGLEYYDRCEVDTLSKRVAKDGNKFSSFVTEIVTSSPFRMRRGDNGGAH
jgi:mono/diheme cytochrome c family protein